MRWEKRSHLRPNPAAALLDAQDTYQPPGWAAGTVLISGCCSENLVRGHLDVRLWNGATPGTAASAGCGKEPCSGPVCAQHGTCTGHPDCLTVIPSTWLCPEDGEGGLGGPGELEATPQSWLLDSRTVDETPLIGT